MHHTKRVGNVKSEIGVAEGDTRDSDARFERESVLPPEALMCDIADSTIITQTAHRS
jgi:hypothetical protein